MGHRNSSDIARDLSRQSNRLSRQGLKSALQGIFRPNRDSSSEGSNITLPVPRTGTVRSSSEAEDIGDFDLPALRKVRKEKERMDVKKGTTVVTYEDESTVPGIYATNNIYNDHGTHEHSTSDNSTMYSCVSHGSEVEVEGGVALIEEAVETHTPDILAIDDFQMRRATIIQDVEMEDDDEVGADTGLQSIMTQV
jgi:Rieske Fe-S protein